MKVQSKAKMFHAMFWFSVCVYLLLLMRVTLFKYASLGEVLFSPERFYSQSVNFIPFAHDGQRVARFKLELFLNFLAFCPLGFLLSMQAYGKNTAGFFCFCRWRSAWALKRSSIYCGWVLRM
jgi:glycopeptide antibiotics resistance protein